MPLGREKDLLRNTTLFTPKLPPLEMGGHET